MSTLLDPVAEPPRATNSEPIADLPPLERQILLLDDRAASTNAAEVRRIAGRVVIQSRSVEDAAAQLATDTIDAVVVNLSDANASLSFLESLAQSHPTVLRFLLADSSKLSPPIVARHCILPTAWDAASLEDAIGRNFALAQWKANSALAAVVAAIHKIPTLPTLYSEISAALQRDCGGEEIARLICKEPAITAKLIQFVNSGSSALSHRIADPTEAVMFFGTQRLRTLVLLSSMFTQFDGAKCAAFSIDQFFKNSLAVANSASAIARGESQSKQFVDMCFTAGLLHDFGVLLLASSLPERYTQAFKFARERKMATDGAELEIFGVSHTDLGGFILATWGLPFAIVNAVGWHHAPSLSQDTSFSPLTAVHIATAINASARSGVLDYDKSYMEKLGLSGKVELWAQRLAAGN